MEENDLIHVYFGLSLALEREEAVNLRKGALTLVVSHSEEREADGSGIPRRKGYFLAVVSNTTGHVVGTSYHEDITALRSWLWDMYHVVGEREYWWAEE